MNQYLETLQNNRNALVEMTAGLSEAQFNFIPPGRENNIIWNLGHILVVSENILYKYSGLRPRKHPFDTSLFGKDTKPEKQWSLSEIKLVNQALKETVSMFEEVTGISVDTSMQSITAKLGLTEGALQFLIFHEGLHYNTIGKMIVQSHQQAMG